MDGLIGGGTEVMGRELVGTMADGKMVMRLFLHGFASLGSTQEYGGWTRPLWNNGDEVFTCCGPARVGGDPACHPQIKCPTHN